MVITRNGTPVAHISPVKRRVPTPKQQAALERTCPMEKGWDIGAGPLDRNSLHER